jgi:hypothetical protein
VNAPPPNARRAYPAVWLVLIILLCAVLKVRHNDRPFLTGADGGLYTDVAEHVRDGDGLVTDVSPYHHGYPAFPHPTAVYPLWPLLYGHLGRQMPMRVAGVWGPTGLYFAALIFAYLWAAPLGRPALLGLGPGHALVLFLGLNGKFFAYTSLPYTEGLGCAVLFACLWRFRKIGASASLRHAAEVGIWLAALVLVRSHFFVVALAAFPALGWAAFGSRKGRDWLRLFLAAAVFVALLVPWYVRVSKIVPKGRAMAMLRYDQARANDLLSPFRAVVSPKGAGAFFADRLAGLGVAFSPGSEFGYERNFHGLFYALTLAIALAAAGDLGRARARPPRGLWASLKGWGFQRTFLVLFSAGSFASLQLMHMDIAQPWLFNHRHALLMIVPFFLAWWILAGSRRFLWTAAAALLGIYTVAASYLDCRNASAEDYLAAQKWRPVARWLADRPPGKGPRVVAASGLLPQLLAPQAPGVGFHGVYEGTTEGDYRVIFDRLGAELLILEDLDAGRDAFLQGIDPEWLSRDFERAAELPGYVVFARKGDRDP